MNKKKYKIISLIIYLVAMIALTMIAIPFLKSFKEPEDFKTFINGFGAWGFLVVLFIQVAQVIVALIPGELVEFIAGTLYGWLGGLLFCVSGIAIGQSLIFGAVKVFGKEFIEAAAGSKAMAKLKFLRDERKLKLVLFLLFLVPGTPKDLITYVVPLTSIRLCDFLIISLFARIPSIITSTFAGSAYIQSNYKTTIITYVIILLISLIGIFIYRQIEKKDSKNL